METTANGPDRERDDQALREAAREAARRARALGNEQVRKLLAEVEELLDRAGASPDPEVTRARGRLRDAVASSREALREGAAGLQRHARDALTAGDTFVRDRTWPAIGVAAVAGLLTGFLLARR
jgi:ElaB protein